MINDETGTYGTETEQEQEQDASTETDVQVMNDLAEAINDVAESIQEGILTEKTIPIIMKPIYKLQKSLYLMLLNQQAGINQLPTEADVKRWRTMLEIKDPRFRVEEPQRSAIEAVIKQTEKNGTRPRGIFKHRNKAMQSLKVSVNTLARLHADKEKVPEPMATGTMDEDDDDSD